MKKFITFLLSFCLIFSLTGCTKRVPVKQQAPQAHEKTHLYFYNLFDPKSSFAGQIQAFESTHPNIKIHYDKFTDPERYEDFVINELAEGKGPDIFAVHNSWMLKHKGKIVPMPTDLPISMNGEKLRQTFMQVVYNNVVFEDLIYGIPMSVDTIGLYYNKEYLANTVPGTNKPAGTWEGIKKQTIILTKRDNSKERFSVTGLAIGRHDNITNSVDILMNLLMEYETKFYDPKTQRAVFAEKQGILPGTGKSYYPGVLALDLYTGFALPSYNHYSWNKEVTGRAPEEKEIDPFVRGKVAMMFGYSYMYERIKVAIENHKKIGSKTIKMEDVRVSEMPQVLDPKKTNKLYSYASFYPLVVSRTSNHPRESWEFIQFITSKESQQAYNEKTHKPSSRLDLQEEQVLNPIYGSFARQAKFAKSIRMLDQRFYNEVFKKAIEEVLDSKNSNNALKKAQNRINCFIKKQADPKMREVNCLQIE